jgi:hypothetical protein
MKRKVMQGSIFRFEKEINPEFKVFLSTYNVIFIFMSHAHAHAECDKFL